MDHLAVLCPLLEEALLAPRVIPEVALVIVPHVLRAHTLGRLLKVVKERLDLLPGEGRPGSLDGVGGPQGKLRMEAVHKPFCGKVSSKMVTVCVFSAYGTSFKGPWFC
jgi:hypothetical protein